MRPYGVSAASGSARTAPRTRSPRRAVHRLPTLPTSNEPTGSESSGLPAEPNVRRAPDRLRGGPYTAGLGRRRTSEGLDVLGDLDQVGHNHGQRSAGVGAWCRTACPGAGARPCRELMKDQFSLGRELAPVVRLPSSDSVEDDLCRCAEVGRPRRTGHRTSLGFLYAPRTNRVRSSSGRRRAAIRSSTHSHSPSPTSSGNSPTWTSLDHPLPRRDSRVGQVLRVPKTTCRSPSYQSPRSWPSAPRYRSCGTSSRHVAADRLREDRALRAVLVGCCGSSTTKYGDGAAFSARR